MFGYSNINFSYLSQPIQGLCAGHEQHPFASDRELVQACTGKHNILEPETFILSYLCNQAYPPAYSLAMWIVKGKSWSETNPKRFWFYKNDNLPHFLENLARN